MSKFLLTAQIKLQAPSNVGKVVSDIRRQLKGIRATVNIVVPPKSQKRLQNANKTLKETKKNAKEAGDSIKKFGEQMAFAGKRFLAFTVATTGVLKFVDAIRNGVKDAIAFERELIKISQVTGHTIKNLRGLTTEITRLSTKFGVSSTKLLEASRILAQTGLAAKDVKVALEAIAKTDLAPTFDDIISTTEGTIAVFRQFKVEAKDLEKVWGSVNAVASKFAVESKDIITAVRRTGGAFAAAGGSLNELIALFTSVRATTRESAESIATGFRTIFTRLQRASTQNFLKSLGIQLRTAEGQFVGPLKAIRALSTAMSELKGTDPRFAQIVEELGGFRQVSKVIPLIQQFATAEKALSVATIGTNSLTKDATVAQQALAIQIQKTKEEFTAMIRKFTNNESFKGMVKIALTLANAFIKVADALEPLLPMMTVLASVGVGRLAGPLVQGFKSKGGFGFASGGIVPGSGNRDTVPASLTPGEYVIRKDAVKTIGVQNLQNLNKGGISKFAEGGQITVAAKEKFGVIYAYGKKVPQTESQISVANVKEKIGKDYAPMVTINGNNNPDSFINYKGSIISDSVEANEAGATKATTFRKLVEASIDNLYFNVGKLLGGDIEDIKVPLVNIEAIKGSAFEGGVSKLGAELSARDKESFENERIFDFPQGLNNPNLQQIFKNKQFGNMPVEAKLRRSDETRKSLKSKISNYTAERLIKDGSFDSFQLVQKAAEGGSIQGVNALLTPGEFVVNKNTASRIGTSNLDQLNNADRMAGGGYLAGFKPTLKSRGTAGYGDIGRRKQYLMQRVEFLRKGLELNVLNKNGILELKRLELRLKNMSKSRTVRNAAHKGMIARSDIPKFRGYNKGGSVGGVKHARRYAGGGNVGLGGGALGAAGVVGLLSSFGAIDSGVQKFLNALTMMFAQFVMFKMAIQTTSGVLGGFDKKIAAAQNRFKSLRGNRQSLLAGKSDATIKYDRAKQRYSDQVQGAEVDPRTKALVVGRKEQLDTATRRYERSKKIYVQQYEAGNRGGTYRKYAMKKQQQMIQAQEKYDRANKRYSTQIQTKSVDPRARSLVIGRQQQLRESKQKLALNAKDSRQSLKNLRASKKTQAQAMNLSMAFAGLGASAMALGSYLEDSARKDLAAGGKGGGFIAGRALSSAATGAGLGAAAGAIAGPIGMAVGGAVGFALGGLKGLIDGQKELFNIKALRDFNKNVAAGGRRLQALNDNKTSVSQQTVVIRDFVNTINKQISQRGLTAGTRKDMKAGAAQQLENLNNYLRLSAGKTTNFEQFANKEKDVINLVSDLSDVPAYELRKQFEDLIKQTIETKAKLKEISVVHDEYATRLRNIVNLSRAFEDVSLTMQKFDSVMKTVSSFAEGNYGGFQLQDQTARIATPEKFYDLDKLAKIVSRDVTNNPFLNTATGNIGEKMGGETLSAASTIKDLPNILLRFKNSIGSFNTDNTIEQLVSEFDKAPDFIKKAIRDVANSIGGEDPSKLIDRLQQDLPGLTTELTKSLKPLLEANALIATKTMEEVNRRALAVDQIAALMQQEIVARNKIVDVEEAGEQLRAKARQGPVNQAKLQELRTKRQTNILGGDSDAINKPLIIGARLRKVENQILAKRAQLERDGLKNTESTNKEMLGLQTRASNLRNGLEYLANTSNTTAKAMADLSKNQAIGKFNTNMLDSVVFAQTPEAKREYGLGLKYAQKSIKTGDIGVVPTEFRGVVKSILESMPEGVAYFGKTGKEALTDLRRTELLGAGVAPGMADVWARGKTSDTDKIKKAISDGINLSIDAAAELANKASQGVKDAVKSFDDSLVMFARELRNIITNQQKDQINETIAGAEGSLISAQTRKSKAQQFSLLFGGEERSRTVGKNLPAIKSLIEKEKSLGRNRGFISGFDNDKVSAYKTSDLNPFSDTRFILRSIEKSIGSKAIFANKDIDARSMASVIEQQREKIASETGNNKIVLSAFDDKLRQMQSEYGYGAGGTMNVRDFGSAVSESVKTSIKAARDQYANIEKDRVALKSKFAPGQELTLDEMMTINTNFKSLSQHWKDFSDGGTLKELEKQIKSLSKTIETEKAKIFSINLMNTPIGMGITGLATGGLVRKKPLHFNKGGVVPGTGDKDSVAAMLTPGEIVIPKFRRGGRLSKISHEQRLKMYAERRKRKRRAYTEDGDNAYLDRQRRGLYKRRKTNVITPEEMRERYNSSPEVVKDRKRREYFNKNRLSPDEMRKRYEEKRRNKYKSVLTPEEMRQRYEEKRRERTTKQTVKLPAKRSKVVLPEVAKTQELLRKQFYEDDFMNDKMNFRNLFNRIDNKEFENRKNEPKKVYPDPKTARLASSSERLKKLEAEQIAYEKGRQEQLKPGYKTPKFDPTKHGESPLQRLKDRIKKENQASDPATLKALETIKRLKRRQLETLLSGSTDDLSNQYMEKLLGIGKPRYKDNMYDNTSFSLRSLFGNVKNDAINFIRGRDIKKYSRGRSRLDLLDNEALKQLGFTGGSAGLSKYDIEEIRNRFTKKKATPMFGGKFRFSSGSFVSGSGSGDTVPALLEPGEFVLNRNAVSAIGPEKLSKFNNKYNRFQTGGPVTPQPNGGVDVSLLDSVIQKFGSQVDLLTNSLNNINGLNIELNARHDVNVTITGAQVLQQLQPSIQNLIVAETNKAISAMLKSKFPDVGTMN